MRTLHTAYYVQADIFAGTIGSSWPQNQQDKRASDVADFVRTAVTVQRYIRAGFPHQEESLDGIFLAYLDHNSTSNDDVAFLDRWATTPSHKDTCFITFKWITRAIACSGNLLAKRVANDIDVAYSMR